MGNRVNKILRKYDRRMNAWKATTDSLKGDDKRGFRRPGSRNPKKLRNK